MDPAPDPDPEVTSPPTATLAALLRAAAAAEPSHDAVVLPGGRATYAELLARADAWARRLHGLGVRPGDHVGVIGINGLEVVAVLFGIALAGGVVVPLNPRYRAAELAHVVGASDVVVLVVDDAVAEDVDFAARLVEALPAIAGTDPWALAVPQAPALRHLVHLGPQPPAGMLSGDAVEAVAPAALPAAVVGAVAAAGSRDPAVIMYTSGTTSHPKGAVLSHESLVGSSTTLAERRYALGPDDRLLDPLPLFHMAGMMGLVGSVACRATFLTLPRVEAGAVLAMARAERPTIAFFGFSAIALAVLEHPDRRDDDLAALRILHTNGAPEALSRLQRGLPHAVVLNPYGCTEIGGMISLSEVTDPLEARLTHSGRPWPGVEVRIVDPLSGTPLPPGARGEITARGWSLFEGYHGDPAATAAVLDDDGWFHTGDLGSLDAEGRVEYVSRLKDMLKVGGENVAAAEVEHLLMGYADVVVAAVVGVPDPRLDEVPVAFVELRPGADVTGEQIRAWCEGRIASFKVPREVRVVTEWPMSATKVQKFRLRDQLLAERGA
ncbi:class I adenylate-forming enzyme family protein [Euzebya sp.]|uniref:class I adenylate-forming enzyme family protein n=1 Tax=Euzebya sp. TaxID=1971409 RepID=UPI00355A852B